MNSSSSNLMGYCTLAIEFFLLKNYANYYDINSFSLLQISFFSLILSIASFFLSSLLLLFFFSLISVASFFPSFSPLLLKIKKKKKRERAREKKWKNESYWNVFECEGEKENKRRGGVSRDRLDTCVEEKNKKKEKEKKKWKHMDENELNEKKNNIKN